MMRPSNNAYTGMMNELEYWCAASTNVAFHVNFSNTRDYTSRLWSRTPLELYNVVVSPRSRHKKHHRRDTFSPRTTGDPEHDSASNTRLNSELSSVTQTTHPVRDPCHATAWRQVSDVTAYGGVTPAPPGARSAGNPGNLDGRVVAGARRHARGARGDTMRSSSSSRRHRPGMGKGPLSTRDPSRRLRRRREDDWNARSALDESAVSPDIEQIAALLLPTGRSLPTLRKQVVVANQAEPIGGGGKHLGIVVLMSDGRVGLHVVINIHLCYDDNMVQGRR